MLSRSTVWISGVATSRHFDISGHRPLDNRAEMFPEQVQVVDGPDQGTEQGRLRCVGPRLLSTR